MVQRSKKINCIIIYAKSKIMVMNKFIYRNLHNKMLQIIVLFTCLRHFCIRTTEVTKVEMKNEEPLNEWHVIMKNTSQYFDFIPQPNFEKKYFEMYCEYIKQTYNVEINCDDDIFSFLIKLPIGVDSISNTFGYVDSNIKILEMDDLYHSFVKKNLIRFECLLLNSLDTLKNYIRMKLLKQLDCTQDEFEHKFKIMRNEVYSYYFSDFEENEICAINLLINALANEVFDCLFIFIDYSTIKIMDDGYAFLRVEYCRKCLPYPKKKIKLPIIERFKDFLGNGEDIIQKINTFEKNYNLADNKFEFVVDFGMKPVDFYDLRYLINMLKIRISKESKLINYIDLFLTKINNKKVKEVFLTIRKNINESFAFSMLHHQDIDLMYKFYPSVNYIEKFEPVVYNSKIELANVNNMINKQVFYCNLLFEFIRLQNEFFNSVFVLLDQRINPEKYPDLENLSPEYQSKYYNFILSCIGKDLSRIYYLFINQREIFDFRIIQTSGDLCLDVHKVVQDSFMQAFEDANMRAENKIFELFEENMLINEHKLYRIVQIYFETTDRKIFIAKFRFDDLIKQLLSLKELYITETKVMEEKSENGLKQTDKAEELIKDIKQRPWNIHLEVSREYDVPYEDSFAFACYYNSLFLELLQKLVEIVNESNAVLALII